MSSDLIEDACQQAWLILLRHQPDRGPTLFAWLVTVAVREGYRLSRIHRRERSLESAITANGEGDAPLVDRLTASGCLDESLEARRALRALAALPERQRRFALLKSAGFSYKEIGQVEDVSVRTVDRQLVRASLCLRAAREQVA
jgi:RNA polymerase sigma factor (sigma-70 family)